MLDGFKLLLMTQNTPIEFYFSPSTPKETKTEFLESIKFAVRERGNLQRISESVGQTLNLMKQ
jgi:hypothetical protein